MKTRLILTLLTALLAGCSAAGPPSPTLVSAPAVTPSSAPGAESPAASSTDDSTTWLARANEIRARLGYPRSADGIVARVVNLGTGVADIVVRLDGGWIVEWSPAGELVSVFRSLVLAPVATPLTLPVVTERIAAIATALGRSLPRATSAESVADLWQAEWRRVVDGIPVMGDGTKITLYADGSFLGFSFLARALEPKPAHVLTQAQAKAALAGAMAKLAPGSKLSVMGAELMWAPPDPPGIGTPSPALRLCWVLTYKTTGKAAGNVPGAHSRAFLDAGTGVELWGDSTS